MRTGAGQHPARRGADDVDDRDHARCGGAPRSGPAHSHLSAAPSYGDSCSPRLPLPHLMRRRQHTPAGEARVVCLFVSQQCHRPRVRRDRSHVCAATAGLRDGVLRRLAGALPSAGSPRARLRGARLTPTGSHAAAHTQTGTHKRTHARTHARAHKRTRRPAAAGAAAGAQRPRDTSDRAYPVHAAC